MPSVEVHDVDVGDIRVRYVAAGDGPVVTLLHPIGLTHGWWEPHLRILRGFRVLAPSLRGHGETGRGRAPLTLDGLARDVIGWWDAIGVSRSHVAGVSMGGMVAQGVAVAAPERVASLVLVATMARCDAAARAAMAERAAAAETDMAAVTEQTLTRWFTSVPSSAGELVARARATLMANDAHTHADCWRAIAALDYAGRLAGVAAPALVLHPERDASVSAAAAEALTAALPAGRLEVVPGAGHVFPFERVEAFAAKLAAEATA